jgi:Copper type II ascorbate-dependent monooxygenase, N-terminal domain
MSRTRRGLAALLATALLTLSGCGGGGGSDDDSATQPPDASQSTPSASSSADSEVTQGHDGHQATPARARPLRPGETRTTIAMPGSYTPSAPYGTGTDDYRCFLLDPELDDDAWLTGTQVLPGNPDVVHHVILFQVAPQQVAAAEAKDAAEDGEGWTCFGGTGLDRFQDVNRSSWIGAWAPGGKESVIKPGFGIRLAKGSRIVMQVHYNLLAGQEPDTSAAQLRLAPPKRPYQSLSTMLLPAPVELPCRPKHDDGELCDRDAALADVKERFGAEGNTADLLYFLCGGKPKPGQTQSCLRTLSEPITIHGVAGHMHLLGRSIKIEVRPGTPQAQTILDIPVWDFDDQGSRPIEPITLQPFEQVKVTCTHVQWLRDKLPAFEGQPDRYVVWGEGTTDEMCLGMLQVTRP